MEALLGIYLLALTAVIFWIMVRDAMRGLVPLLSLRNTFLTGIVLFQTVSGAITAFTGYTEKGAELSFPVSSCLAFSVTTTAFVALFLVIYRYVNLGGLAFRASCTRFVTPGRLLAAGMVMLVVGVALRFAAAGVPLLGVLLPQMAAGALAASAVLFAYSWILNVWNPITGVLMLTSVSVSSAVLMVDAFGRRELLGIGLAVVWGCFQGKWKHSSATLLAGRLAIAGVIAFIPLVLFSAARTSIDTRRTASEQIELMVATDARSIEEATIGMLSGQFAGGISMWVYETRPGDFPVDPLHSLIYFATLPIPRDAWPGKPEGLGLLLVDQALLNGVSSGHSWGPGLAGHLFNDAVLLALPLYAAILAIAFKYMDERVRHSAQDPLSLACFGAALGQILGMPRGDLGLFAFNMISALAGAQLATLFGPRLLMRQLPERPHPDHPLGMPAGFDLPDTRYHETT